jgi:aminocarboxymuconate-semialdehyde decarboxylase
MVIPPTSRPTETTKINPPPESKSDQVSVSRRGFVAATTSIAATAAVYSGIKAKAESLPESTATLPAIDCQSHLFCSAIIERMRKRKEDPVVYEHDGTTVLRMGDWIRKIPPMYLDVDAKLAAMDAASIQMTGLSINDPGPEWFGEDAAEIAQIANDFVHSITKQHPTRFFGIGVLPWLHVDEAIKELERCQRDLGIRGVLLYTNIAGQFSDERKFWPILSKAAELSMPVALHPAKPLTTDIVKGFEMTSTLGNMFDNTIALTRLIMSGILDEMPSLQLICPHLGGALPYIIGRLDHQVTVLKRGPRYLKRKPSEYLNHLWMDIVSPLPLAMKFAYEMVGADRLLFSSDHPWVEPKLIRDCLSSLSLPDEDVKKILYRNAQGLYHLSAITD